MNLSTAPQLTEFTLGAIAIKDDGRITPHVLQVSYAAEGRYAEQALPILLKTIESYAGRLWVINGYSDLDVDISDDNLLALRFRQPFLGSLSECVQNELALACWEAFQTNGLFETESQIKARHITEGVQVAAHGSAAAFRFDYVFGEDFRETCETCMQGRELLKYGEQWLHESVVVDTSKGSQTYGLYQISEKLEKRMSLVKTRDVGSTIHHCAERLFTEANAGAIEMAHITQVNLFGVY